MEPESILHSGIYRQSGTYAFRAQQHRGIAMKNSANNQIFSKHCGGYKRDFDLYFGEDSSSFRFAFVKGSQVHVLFSQKSEKLYKEPLLGSQFHPSHVNGITVTSTSSVG